MTQTPPGLNQTAGKLAADLALTIALLGEVYNVVRQQDYVVAKRVRDHIEYLTNQYPATK